MSHRISTITRPIASSLTAFLAVFLAVFLGRHRFQRRS